jgi:hypothetical protein
VHFYLAAQGIRHSGFNRLVDPDADPAVRADVARYGDDLMGDALLLQDFFRQQCGTDVIEEDDLEVVIHTWTSLPAESMVSAISPFAPVWQPLRLPDGPVQAY